MPELQAFTLLPGKRPKIACFARRNFPFLLSRESNGLKYFSCKYHDENYMVSLWPPFLYLFSSRLILENLHFANLFISVFPIFHILENQLFFNYAYFVPAVHLTDSDKQVLEIRVLRFHYTIQLLHDEYLSSALLPR